MHCRPGMYHVPGQENVGCHRKMMKADKPTVQRFASHKVHQLSAKRLKSECVERRRQYLCCLQEGPPLWPAVSGPG